MGATDRYGLIGLLGLVILAGCAGSGQDGACLKNGVTADQAGLFERSGYRFAPLTWLRCEANSGKREAAFGLGYAYETGRDVKASGKRAIRWYEQAARPVTALSFIYVPAEQTRPYGTFLPIEKGRSEPGHLEAQYRLGLIHAVGLGTSRNDRAALEWLSLAASKGHAGARGMLALLRAAQEHLDRNAQTNLTRLGTEARLADADAAATLATHYFLGEGVRADVNKALGFFRAAAIGGNDYARFAMGALTMAGIGVPPNEKDSLFWIEKAADNDHPDATHLLASYYRTGLGVTQDPAVAWFLLRRTADVGHVPAIAEVGVRLADLTDSHHDFAEAGTWLLKAACLGDLKAQYHYGRWLRAAEVADLRLDAFNWMQRGVDDPSVARHLRHAYIDELKSFKASFDKEALKAEKERNEDDASFFVRQCGAAAPAS